MAKKKNEDSLSYLQMPLPSGRKSYKTTKRSWQGLNYRQTVDTGALSMEKNISTLEAPYLVPSKARVEILDGYDHPIGLYGFDDFLLVIYRDDDDVLDCESIFVDYWYYDKEDDEEDGEYVVYTGLLQADVDEDGDDDFPRCVVQFNKYEQSEDIVSGEYTKYLLIFPDAKHMYFDHVNFKDDTPDRSAHDFTLYDMKVDCKEYYSKSPVVLVPAVVDDDGEVITEAVVHYPPPASADKDCYYRNTYKCEETNYGTIVYKYCKYETVDEDGNADGGTAWGWRASALPAFPDIDYATVHLSRLFGVSKDSVYASGFNDFTNWSLDTSDVYNENNAWSSTSQSNTKAGGDFTGITTFQGHVVCFKRDFMHEIYNTKNPFRIQDVYAEGAIDHRTIQDVDGKLIFVSEDDVKVYTGSNPRIIGYNLNMPEYVNAVSGTDGRCYYLYCEDPYDNKRMFVYDTYTDSWSEQSIDYAVVGFAHNKYGMYMLDSEGDIYQLDTDDYSHLWSFETDLMTNATVDIKHLKKIQMFAYIGQKEVDDIEDSWIKVYALYDNETFEGLSNAEKEKRLLYHCTGGGQKAIRVKPRMSAHYGLKLHFEGKGYVRLYEMELIMENGGGLYA